MSAEYDRHGFGRRQKDRRLCRRGGKQDIDLRPDQLGCQLRQLIGSLPPTEAEGQVLSFGVAPTLSASTRGAKLAAGAGPRKPMLASLVDCCARVPAGSAVAASAARTSRRLIRSPRRPAPAASVER